MYIFQIFFLFHSENLLLGANTVRTLSYKQVEIYINTP